jgi:hypothetical protein
MSKSSTGFKTTDSDVRKIKSRTALRQPRRKLRTTRRKPHQRQLASGSLTTGAPDIGAPILGQVHVLKPKSLTAGPSAIGGEPLPPPGVHRLKAAIPKQRRRRSSPMIEMIRTVLRQRVPEWREGFPSVEQMTNEDLQTKARKVLKNDPRTKHLIWAQIRKSFMRRGRSREV